MTSLISDETDYKCSDICKSDDKWVHDGNWVSHPIVYFHTFIIFRTIQQTLLFSSQFMFKFVCYCFLNVPRKDHRRSIFSAWC